MTPTHMVLNLILTMDQWWIGKAVSIGASPGTNGCFPPSRRVASRLVAKEYLALDGKNGIERSSGLITPKPDSNG